MAWLAAVFGGVLIFAGFTDGGSSPVFTAEDKWGVVAGVVLVVASLFAARKR